MSCATVFCDRRTIYSYRYWNFPTPDALIAFYSYVYMRPRIYASVSNCQNTSSDLIKSLCVCEWEREEEKKCTKTTRTDSGQRLDSDLIFVFICEWTDSGICWEIHCVIWRVCGFFFISCMSNWIYFFFFSFHPNHTSSSIVRTHYTDIPNTSTKAILLFYVLLQQFIISWVFNLH